MNKAIQQLSLNAILCLRVGEPAKHAYIERWATIIIVRVPWIDSCMRRPLSII